MPIQRPIDNYKSVLRTYRALKRGVCNYNTVVMSRAFGSDEVPDPIMLRDFIQIRMLVCNFANNPEFENHQLVLEVPEN